MRFWCQHGSMLAPTWAHVGSKKPSWRVLGRLGRSWAALVGVLGASWGSRRAQKTPGRLQEALGRLQKLKIDATWPPGVGGSTDRGLATGRSWDPLIDQNQRSKKPENRKSTNPQTRPARRSAVADIYIYTHNSIS